MRQQWEYCELHSLLSAGGMLQGYSLDFLASSGMISKDEDASQFAQIMARLGAGGWELVGTYGGRYSFKRPMVPGRRIDDAF